MSLLTMSIATPPLSLAKFLTRPETQPPSELINGRICQKPEPNADLFRLQSQLCRTINAIAEPTELAYASSDLRCNFGGSTIVPDVAVFRWPRIPRLASGQIAPQSERPPNWSIEILSPGQSQMQVFKKLLHCSDYGTEIGWLVDPQEETILVVSNNQRVQLFTDNSILPGLYSLNLRLTTAEVFSWIQD